MNQVGVGVGVDIQVDLYRRNHAAVAKWPHCAGGQPNTLLFCLIAQAPSPNGPFVHPSICPLFDHHTADFPIASSKWLHIVQSGGSPNGVAQRRRILAKKTLLKKTL